MNTDAIVGRSNHPDLASRIIAGLAGPTMLIAASVAGVVGLVLTFEAYRRRVRR